MVHSVTPPIQEPKERTYAPLASISDIHFPKKNAAAAALYEMLLHHRFDVLLRNGDQIDGWALGHGHRFTETQICVLDLINRRVHDEGMKVIDILGNHNEREALRLVRQQAEINDLTISRGVVFIDPTGLRNLFLHGHQFDSLTLTIALSKHGDKTYDELLEKNPDSASFGKKSIKGLLLVMNYDKAYRFAAHLHSADRIIIGHRHLPESRLLVPDNLSIRFKKAAIRRSMRIVLPILPEISAILRSEHVNWSLRQTFNLTSDMALGRVGHEILDLNDTNPDLSLFKNIRIRDLKPLHRNSIPKDARKGKPPVSFIDQGSWIDGNTSYLAFDENGQATLFNWITERIKYGLEQDLPNDETIVKYHKTRFGDFLPITMKHIEYYYNHLSGALAPNDSFVYAGLPYPQFVNTLRMGPNGLQLLEPEAA